jgi:hypothetical protein
MFRKLTCVVPLVVAAVLSFSATASAAPQKAGVKGQRFDRSPGMSHGSFGYRYESYHRYDRDRGFSERYLPSRSESFRYQYRFFSDHYNHEHVSPHHYVPSRFSYWMFFSR